VGGGSCEAEALQRVNLCALPAQSFVAAPMHRISARCNSCSDYNALGDIFNRSINHLAIVMAYQG